MDAFKVIEIQMQAQQVVDLCLGGQAQPHLLHEFLLDLDDEERRIAVRIVQKALEQK